MRAWLVLSALVTIGAIAPVAVLSAPAAPGRILTQPPARPDRAARYLFYLHGRIVQEQGRRATSPKFGHYQYDAILKRFAADGFQVIGEVRPRDTDAAAHAGRVADQVRRLLDAGVPGRRITVVGASMGGYIALLVSGRVGDPEVGYAVLGICGAETIPLAGDLRGEILSIYEAGDDLGGSCGPMFAQAPRIARRREVVIQTGLGHGFLYRPIPEWIDPVVRWARERAADRQGDIASFIKMAQHADCAQSENRLIRIDRSIVFWERAGPCADNAGAAVLFGRSVDDVLCSIHDSIAGSIRSCPAPGYRLMFETILANPDRADLGLGPDHRVEPIDFEGSRRVVRPVPPVLAACRQAGIRHPPMPPGCVGISGALLDPIDDAEFGIEQVEVGPTRLLWLERLTHRDAGGVAHWEVLDVLQLPHIGRDETLVLRDCSLQGIPDAEIVAIAGATEAKLRTVIWIAWRADRRAGRFAPIDTAGIVCVNPAYGV